MKVGKIRCSNVSSVSSTVNKAFKGLLTFTVFCGIFQISNVPNSCGTKCFVSFRILSPSLYHYEAG